METKFRIAVLCLVVGPTTDAKAQTVFNALIALLFRRVLPDGKKKESIALHVKSLPQTTEGLLKVAELVEAAALIEDLRSAKFHFATVIQTVGQIPSGNVKRYVEWVAADTTHREKTIRGVFHPSVLRHYEARLRGLLGPLSDPSHAEQLAAIRPIT